MSDASKVSLEDLLGIMAMLRDKDHGCPWDRKQTFRTIAPHTLEEVYEVIDTIERDDYQHLANELGDLLFQVVFYAQLGAEKGYFNFSDVVSEIGQKLLTRHPHVFPDATMDSFGTSSDVSTEEVRTNWEQIKQAEREKKSNSTVSILDDIPLAFPALTRSRKIQKRAANVGFDWPDYTGVTTKVQEELAELSEAIMSDNSAHIEEELGDVFFSLVNLSRHLKKDPEACLRQANQKFEKRFRRLEQKINNEGLDMQSMSIEQLEQYWQLAKSED